MCIKFSFFLMSCLFADASFAESLYGLKRKSVRLRLRLCKGSGLEKRQRILSVVFLVLSLS